MLGKNQPILDIRSAFIYITEACNLRCGYCYFRHKKGRDLSGSAIERFLALFGEACTVPERFEISGGEPLLRWEKVMSLVAVLKGRFPSQLVDIQTNGLLLTDRKIAFIQKNDLGLEIGIDGDFSTTSAYRKNIDADGFRRLVRNIRLCVKASIRVGCTMTVHPGEAGRIRDNYKYLQSLGIGTIDITPAAFMSWDSVSTKLFQDQYTRLMQESGMAKKVYTYEDRVFLREESLDLSLHPLGYLLCGDVYLCLPEKDRRRYSLWDPKTGRLDDRKVAFFRRLYRDLRRKRSVFTYRDYVCAGFEIVERIAGKGYLNAGRIIPIMRFLTRAHLSYR